jgi:uncharacterized protein YndB with AHSA1/START domain
MSDLTALRIERTYRASARAVFDAWTDPEVMRRWWHAEPPHRLAFTWAWDDDAPGTATQIELRFTESDGATTVALTHAGVGDAARAGHEDGWHHALASLARELEG